MRWIVRGDIDGFFGLALDNLVQLLLIDALSMEWREVRVPRDPVCPVCAGRDST